MADETSELSPEERRKRRIEEAKRRAAARLGKDVSELKSAPSTPAPAPKAEEPKAEVAKAEAAKAEAPKAEPPKAEAPKAETPKAEAPAPESAADKQAARIAAAKAKAAAKKGGAPAAKPAAPARPKAAPTARKAAPQEVGQPGINRREFLAYAWGAALGLVMLEGGLATFQFMYPRFRAGEFGGEFSLGPASTLPSDTDHVPIGNSTGKFWLVVTEQGPKALYMVCTHLGCLYKWEPARTRFECPCHGSKFTREGYYIEGPAPRSLDQFVIEVRQDGQTVAKTEDVGDDIMPPEIPSPDAEVVVDTGKRILGKPSSESPAKGTG